MPRNKPAVPPMATETINNFTSKIITVTKIKRPVYYICRKTLKTNNWMSK